MKKIYNAIKNRNLTKDLLNSNNKTPLFSLDGKTKLCKVVDVYDGDSCKVVFRHSNKLCRWNIRMAGYDSPEMRPSRNKIGREKEIEAAKKARDYLISLVKNENQLVYIKCGEFDKYGRLLGKLYINKDDNKSVNDLMIENKHAYSYDGGTKKIIKYL